VVLLAKEVDRVASVRGLLDGIAMEVAVLGLLDGCGSAATASGGGGSDAASSASGGKDDHDAGVTIVGGLPAFNESNDRNRRSEQARKRKLLATYRPAAIRYDLRARATKNAHS
jgi:hypothetical protein